MSTAHAMMSGMTSTLPVLLLFLGLIIGAVLGWLARAYSTQSSLSLIHI